MLRTTRPVLSTALFTAALAVATALPGLAPRTAFAGDAPPVVVELYTSQGCSSCPPADAFMGDLAKRKDVLGLTFNVDYWDYIGWKDVYARPENDERQREHARHLGLRSVYTPQMVIQGAVNAVGSNRWDVEQAIVRMHRIEQVPVTLKYEEDDQLNVSIAASAMKEPAKILFVAFDDKHTTSIKHGENGGRALSYYNVVRVMKEVGTWSGQKVMLNVPVAGLSEAGRNACAVLVQSEKTGKILGAAQIRLDHPS